MTFVDSLLSWNRACTTWARRGPEETGDFAVSPRAELTVVVEDQPARTFRLPRDVVFVALIIRRDIAQQLRLFLILVGVGGLQFSFFEDGL